MRSSLLPSLVAALVTVTALSACSGNVTTAGAGAGSSGGATGGASSTNSTASTGGAPGSSSVGGGGGLPFDGGGPPPPFDSGPPPFDSGFDAPPPFDGGFDSGPPFDAGLDASPPPPEGGLSCPSVGDACTSCLSVSCADTWCSCYGNVDCIAILKCTGTCAKGDTACNQACLTASPDGISAAELISSCAGQQCPQVCPGNAPLSPCNQCLFSKCDVQMNACVANAECTAYFNCAQTCNGGASCLALCQSDYPGGLVDASKVGTCAQFDCPGLCN